MMGNKKLKKNSYTGLLIVLILIIIPGIVIVTTQIEKQPHASLIILVIGSFLIRTFILVITRKINNSHIT